MRITVKMIMWYILDLYEGWYANDPDDAGGETFRGISRANYPEWHGWELIDAVKGKRDFEELIRKSKTLKEYVLDFYENEYWRALNLYALPMEISTEIFEQAINFGSPRAVRHLQISVNAVNFGICENLAVDGLIGNYTIGAVNAVATERKEQIIKVMNSLQGCRYVELMQRKPVYQKYVGWFIRVDYSLYEEIKRKFNAEK